ncbi:hypothetical protein FIBSPDRAFT_1051193 [Athelia psychrophila]|uniref:Uncharacterized protein n=1 Tax=Athelia psychrophila TaxID=1759441 RepID=A0A165ZL68_9AGAM|nr:hypothetical protein FIBSPDRAFT_1051193 [Fibularhizoctonia sp. CBS 109695]
MFTRISLLALAAASVSAAPSRRGSCSSGYTSGSTTTTMTINAPIGTMQTLTMTSSTGTDNQSGATRSFNSGGVLLSTEQLTSYTDNSPTSIDRLWIGIGGARPSDPLPISVAADNITIDSWTEHFTITSACSGASSFWTWTASYCTSNDAVALEFYTDAHTGPLYALATQYGNSTC